MIKILIADNVEKTLLGEDGYGCEVIWLTVKTYAEVIELQRIALENNKETYVCRIDEKECKKHE